MPRKVSSQWNFGELFPAQESRKVFSVSELTARIRGLLEKQFGRIWVTGEITNLRAQASGHIYFSLKDSNSQISCVVFRGEPGLDRSLLEDGRRVNLRGELTVYEPRGQYQLRVDTVEPQGVGALQAAFEKLKMRLNAEGLFAPEHKRPLPRFIHRLGLVTSPTGAAIQDVLQVLVRRDPSVEVYLAPCRVQGDGAAAEIARAIDLLNELNDLHPAQREGEASQGLSPNVRRAFLDVILVTRGGGSLEDLWAFNEEIVARAIYASNVPVVSAVGHEIDYTISDFVADFRAATPTAAAEILTEGVFGAREFIASSFTRLGQLAAQQLEAKVWSANNVTKRLLRQHPRRRLGSWVQRLDEARASMARCTRVGLRRCATAADAWLRRLNRVRPSLVLSRRREVLMLAGDRLHEAAKAVWNRKAQRFALLESRLRLLGPKQVLARGYSITTVASTGRVVRQPGDAQPGVRLLTRLREGAIQSVVSPDDRKEDETTRR